MEDSHLFDKDLQFGEFLKRPWLEELTKEDMDLLNTRVSGSNRVSLPDNTISDDTWYACPMN